MTASNEANQLLWLDAIDNQLMAVLGATHSNDLVGLNLGCFMMLTAELWKEGNLATASRFTDVRPKGVSTKKDEQKYLRGKNVSRIAVARNRRSEKLLSLNGSSACLKRLRSPP